MARLALAGGGALVGGLLGGQFGASVGWAAGSLIGGMLFPEETQDVVVEGPRLADKQVSSAAYGRSIAIGYGTIRTAGNLIWSSGIEEVKNTETTSTGGGKGGGGGGASQTTVTYSYYASFAIAFAEGPAEDVLRVWADSKLIYDKTGTGRVTNETINWRFYYGDEEQLPDALIEADVGEGDVPGHRGLCYMIFEQMPLANYGNRIPNITAEITFKRTNTYPYLVADIDTSEFSYQTDELTFDPKRRFAYLRDAATPGALRRINARTMVEDRIVAEEDVTSTGDTFSTGMFQVGRDGYIYCCTSSSNRRPILQIDPNTLIEVDRFGTASAVLANSTGGFVASNHMATIEVLSPEGLLDYYNVFGSFFNDWGILSSSMDAVDWGEIDETNVGDCVSGDFNEAFVIGYARGFNSSFGVYRADVEFGAGLSVVGGTSFTSGVTFTKVGVIPKTRFTDSTLGATSGTSIRGVCFDRYDGNLIFFAEFAYSGPTRDYVFKVDSETLEEIWRTQITSAPSDQPGISESRVSGLMGWCAGGAVYSLNTVSGEVTKYADKFPNDGSPRVSTYDSQEDAVYYLDSAAHLTKAFLNRGTGEGETLANIVTDISDRVGLELADINTSELTDLVPGYLLGRQVTGRGAMTPLLRAYFFDGVESDYLIDFKRRGRSSVLTIEQDDLAPVGDAGDLEESRVQEVELPEQIDVIHFDKDNNYEQGDQHAKRPREPLPAMFSNNRVSMNLPIALSAETAKRIAEKTLYTAWVERTNFRLVLPWKYLKLDPADVFVLSMDDGTDYTIRMLTSEIGLEYTIESDGLSEQITTYESSTGAYAGAGVPAQVIPVVEPSEFFLLDVPLLRDQDATGGEFSRVYFAVGAYDSNWPGALIYQTADNLTWSNVGRATAPVAWGAVLGTLAAPSSPWHTDEETTLRVSMSYGADELSSVTQLEMLNGANAAVVGNEVIQFRDVVEVTQGVFELTGLLRGRRGTDPEVDGHVTGEDFILLQTSTIETFAVALDVVDRDRTYRAVTYGSLFEEAERVSGSVSGKDLKPYAPVHLDAEREVDDDILLDWERRTRIGGELRDGTGTVPLSEDTEEYEIEILDGPGGNILRTVTGVIQTQYLYTQAEQAADGWSGPDITFKVYQISAAIDRGFGTEATVAVGTGNVTSTSTTTS